MSKSVTKCLYVGCSMIADIILWPSNLCEKKLVTFFVVLLCHL